MSLTPDIHIPDEALEAAEAEFLRGIASGDWDSEKITRAACRAMLKSWPGMYIGTDYLTADTQVKLPLPQEPRHE